MWIDTYTGKREFRHIGLTDDDRPCGTQALYNDRILRCLWRIAHDFGACRGDFTSHVEQIFDRNDSSIQRTQRNSECCAGIGRYGFCVRRFRIDLRKNSSTLVASRCNFL